jgi:hypothetical protein
MLCGNFQMQTPAIMFQVIPLALYYLRRLLILLQAAMLQYVLVAKSTVSSESAMFNAGIHW